MKRKTSRIGSRNMVVMTLFSLFLFLPRECSEDGASSFFCAERESEVVLCFLLLFLDRSGLAEGIFLLLFYPPPVPSRYRVMARAASFQVEVAARATPPGVLEKDEENASVFFSPSPASDQEGSETIYFFFREHEETPPLYSMEDEILFFSPAVGRRPLFFSGGRK